jgi:hypothetical protein
MDRSDLAGTTTYVQLLGYSDFDQAVEEAMKDWDITERVVFVAKGEPFGDVTDSGNSFLTFWDLLTGPTVDRSLAFWQGGEAWANVEPNDGVAGHTAYNATVIASWPMDIYGKEIAYERMAWRMPLVIASLRQMMEHMRVTGASNASPDQIAEGGLPTLRRKTLLVRNDRLEQNEIDALRAYYPYPMEVVSIDVIDDAIRDQDELYAIFCPLQGMTPSILVYDAASGRMLFAQRSAYSKPLGVKHMKTFAKAVAED